MNYGHKLQDLRRRDGLTQKEVARLLGYRRHNTIGDIEANRARVGPQSIRLITLWDKGGLEALKQVQP